MLDANVRAQLKSHFDRLVRPVEITVFEDDGAKSRELLTLIDEICKQSDMITVQIGTGSQRVPSLTLSSPGEDIHLTFAGVPLGHEFTSLVLAILQVGGCPPMVEQGLADQIKAIRGLFRFETYYSLSCQNCPDVVQALNLMSVLNPNIEHIAIDGALFQAEVEMRQVMAVPTTFLNGEPFGSGRMEIEEILSKMDLGAAERATMSIKSQAPFEILIIGGGPSGAAAAIYAARKGVRTGIIGERFGGQVLDTLAIENLVSVPHIEGPKLAQALDAHLRTHDLEIMKGQQATRLERVADGFSVKLAGGGTLSAKSVIICTGAHWRKMGVPGEEYYLNKGVAFCPHCDGPLFKGKRVAVIGGGNSGVEAAIDLAGLAANVILIEFERVLRADVVLQRKLKDLRNVTVLVATRTVEVQGDGDRVTGVALEDRTSSKLFDIALDGVFVQIGLVPSTQWLQDTLALSPRGEVIVDAHGATSVPGVFAAGDCTTIPYKQIAIALGDGAKASLAAFDHLIRLPGRKEAA